MALIVCQDVSFAYDGNTIVHGLNFTVNSGEILCIVGENGSGKSTLIKGLLRLKKPQSGQILFGDGLKAEKIGYQPQQTAAQKDFPASVYEVVLSGRLAARGLFPFYSKADQTIAHQNIRRLGLDGLQKQCYRGLSGGQQQRVLLARALCAARKLLLLDEPAAGLDPVITQELYRLIEQINRETGITVIMVSHDIQSAVQYASHILHLKNSQVFFGKAEDYVNFNSGFLGGCVHV